VMLPLVHTNMMQLLIMRKFRSHYAWTSNSDYQSTAKARSDVGVTRFDNVPSGYKRQRTIDQESRLDV
jgi:hypothetical protein